jgi:hypothetical protein
MRIPTNFLILMMGTMLFCETEKRMFSSSCTSHTTAVAMIAPTIVMQYSWYCIKDEILSNEIRFSSISTVLFGPYSTED